MAWKLKHIQTMSIPVNVNPIHIFSAEPFIERYLVSLSKTLKPSTWQMCSSFLWLKCSNIQPNGGSNPHRPPPQNKRLCKGSQWIFIKESQGELTWLTRCENVLKWSCFPWFPLFSSFSLFFGKIQLQVNNNRQSKTGFPTWQLSQTVNTCLKKT